MMKRFAALLTGAGALTNQPANATTYSPTGSWAFEGAAEVYSGIKLTCDVILTLDVTSTNASATMSFSGGFLNLCAVLQHDTTYAPDVTIS